MPIKRKLHPRNKHNKGYDFQRLCQISPSLTRHIVKNKFGRPSINFASAIAIRALNRAILEADYNVQNWTLPEGFLCPPIPGRVDYIHYIADLLAANTTNKKKRHRQITGLDVGTGASCIYPLLGQREYQWQFIASDIDLVSINSSQAIIDNNEGLDAAIRLRLQPNRQHMFQNVINQDDRVDFTMCNPPFHESRAQANHSNARKRRNLGTNKKRDSKLNFGGQNAELWCEGGEREFVRSMILESKSYGDQVLWFTSLISNRSNLRPLKESLRDIGANEIQIIGMAQGQKVSRFIAWTFLRPRERTMW